MSLPFDPTEYECVRAPVVDSFTYQLTTDDGAIEANIGETFLRKTAANMNERARTGNLCPIVIGHTPDEPIDEAYAPQKVGWLSDYDVAPFETPEGTKQTLFAKHWIKKEQTVVLNGAPVKLSAKELCDKFPHRSGELWLTRHEVHPHSLLGATAPERALGVLKLSATGNSAFNYTSPGKLEVNTTALPGADAAPMKALEGVVAQLSALVSQLTAALPQKGAEVKPGDKPAGDGAPDDAELDALLSQLDGDTDEPKDEKKEEPKEEKKEEKPKEKDEDEKVKLQRERDEAVLKLQRSEVVTQINDLRTKHFVDLDPTDEAFISDLLSQPPEMRARWFDRMKLGRKLPGYTGSALTAALGAATAGNGKRITSNEDNAAVIKLARQKNVDFKTAATELGFTL